MKGLAPATAIIFTLAIFAIAGGLYFLKVHVSQLHSAIRAGRELVAFTVLNFADLTKLYLKQAFYFSVSQAAYDLGKKGGFISFAGIPFDEKINLPYWYLFSQDFSPTLNVFENNLKNLTQSNIDAYLKQNEVDGIKISFENYSISITSTQYMTYCRDIVGCYNKGYDECVRDACCYFLERENICASVCSLTDCPSACCEPEFGYKREISFKPKTEIEALVANSSFSLNFEDFYGIRIFELFSIAKENKIDVKEVVVNVLDNLDKTGSLEKKDKVCPSITDEEVFKATTGMSFEEAKVYITNEIRNGIKRIEDNLNRKYREESWLLEPKEINVKIISNCKYDYECVKADESCIDIVGCSERTELGSDACTEGGRSHCCYWIQKENQCVSICSLANCPTECCRYEYNFASKKSCNFDYYAYADVKVKVTDLSKEYIIWDGAKASREKISLNFLIKDGKW
jgi:hypothetical protein